jgi:hypothetical protein
LETGYSMNEIKEVMKADCPGWEWEEVRVGKTVKMRPISESRATPAMESAAIAWCHMRAADLNIILAEASE